MRSQSLTPVFLGADLCCYGLARAFRERGYVSYAFGKMRLGATAYCPFLRFTEVPELGRPDVLCQTLEDFAKKRTGRILVLPCTDEYVRLLSSVGTRLSERFTVVAPSPELFRTLAYKDAFYRVCDIYRIPYPKTEVLTLPVDRNVIKDPCFPYPAILKPADSVEYFRHPFPDMEKVYLVQSAEHVAAVTAKWQNAGYTGKAILQDRVPGPDDCLHVLTFYCDRAAKVKAVVAGRVLLEEKTVKGRGNHAAVFSEKPPAIARNLAAMLERIGYRGICHFDMKFDARDGEMKVFEVNLRPGRSNLYLAAAGCSLPDLLISDLIENKTLQFNEYYKPTLFHAIPLSTVYRYTADTAAANRAKALARAGRAVYGLPGINEMRHRPLRALYRIAHDYRETQKYKKSAVRYR